MPLRTATRRARSSDFDDPAAFPDEVEFLPTLIGEFTDAVMAFVKAEYPDAKFEVLYPTDVNNTPLNRLINYPAAHWTPSTLDNLNTENFTFTITRKLDNAEMTVDYGVTGGFPRTSRELLVGIGDPTLSWRKEVEFALAENLESIVFFCARPILPRRICHAPARRDEARGDSRLN